MYKITDIIERPSVEDVADLPLDEFVACVRELGVAEQVEIARPVHDPRLPEPDHLLVVEAWFTDLEQARSVPESPGFARLDELATRIHAAAGIRRYLSEIV